MVITHNSNNKNFETRYHVCTGRIYIEDNQKRNIQINNKKELSELIKVLIATKNNLDNLNM